MLRSLPARTRISCRSFAFTPLSRFPRTQSDNKRHLEPVSFQEQVARTTQSKTFSEQVRRPRVINQVLYFVFGSSIAFAFAANKTNLDTEIWVRGLKSAWLDRLPTNDEIRRTQYFELGKKLQARVANIREATEGWPSTFRNLVLMSYVNLAQRYLDSTEGRRMCWKICAVNSFIWLAWKIPSLQHRMITSFMHHPRSGLSYTLLTSMFSHKGIVHLSFNCMALSSFGAAASHFLAKEQTNGPTGLRESTPKWHFLAFYISAGLFSGLVSHIASATIRYPRLISQIISAETKTTVTTATTKVPTPKTLDVLPSLGASGAVYAAATLTALGFPEMEIALILPPTSPIPIQYGIGTMVIIDMMGVLRGWRYLDHWAHLGGAAFGAFYYMYGPRFWDHMRIFPYSGRST